MAEKEDELRKMQAMNSSTLFLFLGVEKHAHAGGDTNGAGDHDLPLKEKTEPELPADHGAGRSRDAAAMAALSKASETLRY